MRGSAIITVVAVMWAVPCAAKTITVDDDGPADFATIQAAIDDANDGDAIVVQTGLYKNDIYFLGRNITLTSTNPRDPVIVRATTIGCEDNEAKIIFNGSEDANCILTGFDINGYVQGCETRIAPICECENHTHATISHCIFQRNCGLCGIVIMCCDGTINNCLFADNKQCVACVALYIYPPINECHGKIINCTITNNNGCCQIFVTHGTLTIENSIIYDSQCANGLIYMTNGELNASYNDVKGGLNSIILDNGIVNWGLGNIDADPHFADPNNGDYHLKSQAGRWEPDSQSWVQDDATSPCIDAGDPNSCLGFHEPYPNGLLLNMGAYGGTAEASMSLSSAECRIPWWAHDHWVEVGEPICWCYPRQCHGDADCKCQGRRKYWVSINDLDILIAAWNKTFAEIDGKTLNGVPLICADFDHIPQGKAKFPVSTMDLDILIANWQVANGPTADCP